MRRYTLEIVHKLPQLQVAHPFPGQYPTRMAVLITYSEGTNVPTFSYVGKTNGTIKAIVLKAWDDTLVQTISVKEFDKKSVIRNLGVYLPAIIHPKLEGTLNQRLVDFYYPFGAKSNSDWLRRTFIRKRLVVRPKTVVTVWTTAKLISFGKHINPWKAWVAREGVL